MQPLSPGSHLSLLHLPIKTPQPPPLPLRPARSPSLTLDSMLIQGRLLQQPLVHWKRGEGQEWEYWFICEALATVQLFSNIIHPPPLVRHISSLATTYNFKGMALEWIELMCMGAWWWNVGWVNDTIMFWVAAYWKWYWKMRRCQVNSTKVNSVIWFKKEELTGVSYYNRSYNYIKWYKSKHTHIHTPD